MGIAVWTEQITNYENGILKSYETNDTTINVSINSNAKNFYSFKTDVKTKKTQVTESISLRKINDSTFEIKKNSFSAILKIQNHEDFSEYSFGDDKVCIGSSYFAYFMADQKTIFYSDGCVYCAESKNWDGNPFFLNMYRIEEQNTNSCTVGFYECVDDQKGGSYYFLNSFELQKTCKPDSNFTKFINFLICKDYISLGKIPFYFILDSNTVSEYKTTCISYTSDSALVEKKASYKASNLSTISGLPWASSNGFGIGDKIEITVIGNKSNSLCLYNGFQSENESLYLKNSRAKRIEVSNKSSKEKKIFELKDTKEKQTLDLTGIIRIPPKSFYKESCYNMLEIKILEVYPGTKYKDLCIQAIIPATE